MKSGQHKHIKQLNRIKQMNIYTIKKTNKHKPELRLRSFETLHVVIQGFIEQLGFFWAVCIPEFGKRTCQQHMKKQHKNNNSQKNKKNKEKLTT